MHINQSVRHRNGGDGKTCCAEGQKVTVSGTKHINQMATYVYQLATLKSGVLLG